MMMMYLRYLTNGAGYKNVLWTEIVPSRSREICCYVLPLELRVLFDHSSDVMMGVITSQIISLTIVYRTIYSGVDL